MLVRIFDPKEESLETSLIDYSVLKVKLKDASIVIEKLNKAFPLENGRHLKRIRKIKYEDHVTVLICNYSEYENDSLALEKRLNDHLIPFENISTVSVPNRNPTTKKQYENWNLIWPLVFHESMDEKIKVRDHTDHSLLFELFRSYFFENKLSLLIVESSAKILMDETLIIHESENSQVGCNQLTNFNYPFDHVVINSLISESKNKRLKRNGKVPYLLSGCVAILSHEPCTMCSMALLHSRIDAVIYINSNKVSGSLGSKCFLNSMSALNHRFPVYCFSPD